MVVAGAAPSLTSFRAHTIPSSPWKLNFSQQKCQCTIMGLRVMKHKRIGTKLWPCLESGKNGSSLPIAGRKIYLGWADELLCSFSRNKKYDCRALLEGTDDSDDCVDLKRESLFDSQERPFAPVLMDNNSNGDSDSAIENRGKSGIVWFSSSAPLVELKASADVEKLVQRHNEAWVSVLWILGPLVLVSSVVLPPFFLRKMFELLLEDSLLTDFLILFFTETLFYAGVFAFLLVAHKVQQATGVFTWRSGSRASFGYKISTYVSMVLAVLLPLAAFAMVWPWTGPAAAAALLPYVAGLVVQYGFEQVVQEKKWSVWPLIPIIFQVYRLHQLNRATQLVAGLLYSLRGAEATTETLAVNASLQSLVMVLQLLGMLCLWSLAAYLTHVFSSESEWQRSRGLT